MISFLLSIPGRIIQLVAALLGFVGAHFVVFALLAVVAYLVVIHYHLLTKLAALEKSINLAELISSLLEKIEGKTPPPVAKSVPTPSK